MEFIVFIYYDCVLCVFGAARDFLHGVLRLARPYTPYTRSHHHHHHLLLLTSFQTKQMIWWCTKWNTNNIYIDEMCWVEGGNGTEEEILWSCKHTAVKWKILCTQPIFRLQSFRWLYQEQRIQPKRTAPNKTKPTNKNEREREREGKETRIHKKWPKNTREECLSQKISLSVDRGSQT